MSGRDERLVRGRLVLGQASESALDARAAMSADDLAADAALGWLYDRDADLLARDIAGRQGDLGASALTVPTAAKAIAQRHQMGPFSAWPAKLAIALAETASALVPMAMWGLETPTT